MNLTELDYRATKIGNCVFGDLESKQMAKDSIMLMIISACELYVSDQNFKNQLNQYKKQLY